VLRFELGVRFVDFELDLEPRPESARIARDALRDRVGSAVPLKSLQDLELVVTELVTNSVRHGPGLPFRLRLEVTDEGVIRGEVEDQGNGGVAIRDMEENGGAGLRIVDALTDKWGVYEGSTHVWFEFQP
jgi:anti-sigma regulatory factor (Ser/Thr protein kinase)